ncbi:hypothetical protein VRRI112168_12590 [Vreelandella rituensis]
MRLQVVGGEFIQPLSQRCRARHLLQSQQLLEGLVAADVFDGDIRYLAMKIRGLEVLQGGCLTDSGIR